MTPIMRPRILYELSQCLALLLEKGLRGDQGERHIPVLLCHPLDPLEEQADLEGGTVGILYLSRLNPERRYPQAGMALESRPRAPRLEQLRLPGLWVNAHYTFLVAGGALEDQLTAMAAALETLHDHPYVQLEPEALSSEPDSVASRAGATSRGGAPPGAEEGAGAPAGEEVAAFPLRVVEEKEGWREIGLHEHRLTIAFEVTLQIASAIELRADRTQERHIDVDLTTESPEGA